MTVKEMVETAHKEGWYRINGLSIHVTIKDIRRVWNRTDYLVSPVDGGGETWVSEEKISWK